MSRRFSWLDGAHKKLLARRGGSVSLFLHGVAVVQVSGNGGGDPVPGLQPLGYFEALTFLVFCLSGREYLLFGDLIASQQEDFVDAVAIVDCGLRYKYCRFFFFAWHGSLHEKAGLESPVFVVEQGFRFEGPRVLGDAGVDARDFSLEGFVPERLDVQIHDRPFLHPPGPALRNGKTRPQMVSAHQDQHWALQADIFSGMNAASFNRAGEGSANGGVPEFFFRQFRTGLARDQQCFQPLHFLHGQIVAGLRAVVAAFDLVKLLLGDQFVVEHLFGASVFVVRVKKIGFGALHHGHLLRIAGKRRSRPDSKLSPNLFNDSLLAIHLILQFALIEKYEWLAFVTVSPTSTKTLSTRPSTCALKVLSSRARREPTAWI